MELPDALHDRIVQLSRQGDALADAGRAREAVETYLRALDLVPEPKRDWEASTWLLTAIGDALFAAGHHAQARNALADALHCPGGADNPFVQLRLGQCLFELGELAQADDALARAYMGAGREIFEHEDPRYFAHLKTVLRPPADGHW